MSAPAAHSASAPAPHTPWWFRLVRAALNFLLLGLLVLQGVLLVILATNKHLTLPAFAREAIENELRDQGVSVKFDSVDFALSGEVMLRNPQIFLTGTSDPVAVGELLIVEPDWFTLFWSRDFALSRLRLDEGQLFCPPEISPSGARDPLIHGLDVEIESQGGRWWKLTYFRAQVLNAKVIAGGTAMLPKPSAAPPAGPGETPVAPSAPRSLAAQYRDYARQAAGLQKDLDGVVNPVINLQFTGREPGITTLDLTILAEGMTNAIPGLDLGPAWSRAQAEWDGQSLRATQRAIMWVESSRFSQDVTDTGTTGTVHREILSGGPAWALAELADGIDGLLGMPKRAWFQVSPVNVYGFPFDSMAANWDLSDWPRMGVKSYASQSRNWLKCDGQADFDQRTLTMSFESEVDPAVVLRAARLDLPRALRALHFQRPPHIAGRLKLGPGFAPEGLTFRLDAGGTEFQPLPVRPLPEGSPPFKPVELYALVASGELTSDELLIRETTLWNDTWTLSGRYWQDLQTDQYRILADGTVNPAVLDPYIIGDWWIPLWKFIVPGGHWPDANIDYQGFWGPDSNEDIMNALFGSVTMAGARVRGVLFDDLGVRVYQRRDVTAVYDLRAAANGGGGLNGELLWMLRPPYQHLYEQRYILTSTLPLRSAATVAGPSVESLTRPLNFPTAPTVHIDQRFGGSANPEKGVTATSLRLNLDAPFYAYGIPMESVAGTAMILPGYTEITQLDVGLAGGIARAHATVADLGDDTELAFNVSLIGGRHAGVLIALSNFNADGEIAKPLPASSGAANEASMFSDPNRPGKIDVTIGTRVLLGRGDTFAASGHARIYEAKLGQLHLFGILSQVLSGTPLPLGSLQLDSAESDIQIAANYGRFPNVRITGPSARIMAGGLFYFPENRFDFRGVLFPMGQWKIPVLEQFLTVLGGLNNAFTMHLTGTLEKPQWSLGVDLGRIVSAQNIRTPPIPGYPAYADGSPILPSLPFPPAPLPPSAPPEPPAPGPVKPAPTFRGSPQYR